MLLTGPEAFQRAGMSSDCSGWSKILCIVMFAHLRAGWRDWGGESRRGCELPPLQLCIGVKVHLSTSFLKWKGLIEDLSCGVWWQTGCAVSPSIPSLLPCPWLMWRAFIALLLALLSLPRPSGDESHHRGEWWFLTSIWCCTSSVFGGLCFSFWGAVWQFYCISWSVLSRNKSLHFSHLHIMWVSVWIWALHKGDRVQFCFWGIFVNCKAIGFRKLLKINV